MSARLAPDGRPVCPEDVRAVIQRGQDRRAEVERARTPLDGISAGQWTDRDVISGLVLLLLALVLVVFDIGLIYTVIYCCHHWRGTTQGLFVAVCGAILLVALRLTRDIL